MAARTRAPMHAPERNTGPGVPFSEQLAGERDLSNKIGASVYRCAEHLWISVMGVRGGGSGY